MTIRQKRYLKSDKFKKKIKEKMNKKKKKTTRKPIRIFTLDTETRGLHGDVFRIGLYDGTVYRVKNNFEELLETILHYTQNFECHIYVHNLEFDLKKGADYLMGKVDLGNTRYINNVAAIFTTQINNVMSRYEKELERFPITFHCSYQLIPRSLGDISQSFNLKEYGKMSLKEIIIEEGYALYDDKGEFDEELSTDHYFNTVDPLDKNLNKYLKRDCTSLYEIVTTIQELSQLPLHEFVKIPSVASLSINIYKTLFPDDYKTAISGIKYGNESTFKESFLRAAYNGGRTEVFKNRIEKGYAYDVNSLYPYVMKAYKMPVGEPILFTDVSDSNVPPVDQRIEEKLVEDDINERESIAFVECDVYVPDDLHIPVLPTVYRGKLSFLTGNITGIWTDKELKKAISLGCEVVEYKQMLYFEKTRPIFKEFVKHFEEMKKNSEGAKREYSKLILNSLYGKFAMRRKFHTLLDMDELEKVKKSGEPHAIIENQHYGKQMIETFTYSKAEYIRVHISAFITSMARLVLYDAMEIIQEKGGNVYYVDTDSIYTDIPLPDELVDKVEFGKWKKEQEIKEGIFIGPKNYAVKTNNTITSKKRINTKMVLKRQENKVIIKSKGIPKRYTKKWTYDFYRDLFRDKLEKRRNYVEVAETTQFQKSKVSLKNNDHMNTYRTIIKGIHLDRDEKRIFNLKENTSKPIQVNFWGEGEKDLPDNEYFRVDPSKILPQTEIQFYQENDILLQIVKKVGKIRLPKKSEPYYDRITQLNKNIRQMFFTNNEENLPLHEFVKGIDNMMEKGIVEELESMSENMDSEKERNENNIIEIF